MTLLGRGACHKWHLAIIQQHLLAHCAPGTVLGAEPFPPACRPGKGDQSHGAWGPHSSEVMDQPVSGQRVICPASLPGALAGHVSEATAWQGHH